QPRETHRGRFDRRTASSEWTGRAAGGRLPDVDTRGTPSRSAEGTDVDTLKFFGLLLEVNARTARRRIAALRQQSWLMVSVIALFVLGYWMSGYFLFSLGFKHLAGFPGLGVLLVDRMLYLFFAFLFVMLIFSNMIIGYASMFKS